MTTTVNVWNTPVEVSTYQSSKSVWIAVGYYLEERIETKGRSQGAAIIAWRRAATYKGG